MTLTKLLIGQIPAVFAIAPPGRLVRDGMVRRPAWFAKARKGVSRSRPRKVSPPSGRDILAEWAVR